MSGPRARSTYAPTAALLLVVAIWGATFTVVKEALQDASTLAFLALRFSVASAVLAVFLARRLGMYRPLWTSVRAGLLAGVALFGGYFLQTAGLHYTSAPKSAFITSLSVVAVPLLAAFVYKSVPRPTEVAGVALATIGLALLTLQGQGPAMGLGDLLTLGCAFCFGAHVLVLAHFAPRCSFEVLSLTQICLTALIALATFWWAEPARIRWTPRFVVCLGGDGRFGHRSGLQRSNLGPETSDAPAYSVDPLNGTGVRLDDFVCGGGRIAFDASGGGRGADSGRSLGGRTETVAAPGASIQLDLRKTIAL
ncbi:MAG: DMT family transporter [Bryobacteraceae bacterium]